MKTKLNSFTTLKNRIAVRLFLIVLVLVLPLNLLALFGAWKLNQELKEQFRLDKKNILDVHVNSLNMDMQRIEDSLFEWVTEDEEFILLRNQRNDVAYQNAKFRCYEMLRDQLQKESSLDGYFFLMKDLDDEIFELSPYLQEEKETLSSYLNLISVPEEKWQTVRLEGHEYLIRVSKFGNMVYGSIISGDRIKENLLREVGEQGAEVSLGRPTGTNWMIQLSGTLTQAKDALFLSYRNDRLFQNASLWNRLLFMGAFLFLLVIPILYIYLNRLVVKPLGKLQTAHKQMEKGNREYRILEKADTQEFQIVYNSFNSMMQSIQNLKIENMEKELEKKRLELNNLQLQIRPHFLLNTFNLICTLCDGNQLEKIQEVMIYLSNYFRYIFSSGKDLELFQKEFTLIEGYIKAAKIRYPGRVNILYEIEPEISMVRLPPLLLHNFVENSVSHGMPKDREINILLEAWYEDGEVFFRLSDDGNGMEEEQVRQINEEKWETAHSHLGIQNSVKRLKYFYGENAGIQVESMLGNGSVFEIRFPYELEE